MARFGRSDGDAPRVVGFDLPSYAAEPEPVVPAPPPPAWWTAAAAQAPAAPAPEPAYPPPPAPGYAPAPGYEPAPAPATVGTPPAAGWAPLPPAPWAPAARGPEAPAGAWAPATAPPPGFQPFDRSVRLEPVKPPRDGIRREVTIVLVVLVLIGVAGGVQRVLDGRKARAVAAAEPSDQPLYTLPPTLADLNAPPTVGGRQRLTTRYSRAVARLIRSELPNGGRDAEIEVYGSFEPEYAIVGGELTKKRTSRAFWTELTAESPGLRTAAPRSFGNGQTCSTYRGPSGTGSFCAWVGKRSDGVVFGYGRTDLTLLARVSHQARIDLERGE